MHPSCLGKRRSKTVLCLIERNDGANHASTSPVFFHSLVARLSSISIETLAVPVGNRNDAGQVHLA